MFVSVESGESGWSFYVYGDAKNRREGATLIKGDLALGDAICQSTDYKSGQYFRIVLSFHKEENVAPKKGREIAKEFMEHLLHGYREDEYHLDMVEHTDTDELHYHIRVPKLNLLTGTQLHYHYLSDIKRKDAIHKYMEIKHDLLSPFEKRKLIPDPKQKVKQINQWREEHAQQPFDLSNKKGRGEAEERVSDYIQEMVKGGFLTTLEEVQAELISMDFSIAKVGHDNGKDFDYITIENDTGKLRLKGDIYGERFYEHSREDRAEAIKSGRSLERRDRHDGGSLEQAKRELDAANKARSEFIAKRFKTARERALSGKQAPTQSDRGSSGNKRKNSQEQRREADLEGNEDRNRARGNHGKDQKQIHRRVEDDRVGREAIKRVRSLRARAKQRERKIINAQRELRKEYQNSLSRFDAEISRELARINEAREQRRGESSRILENAYRAKQTDYPAIAATQRSRTTQRATRRGFKEIVRWLAGNLQHFKRKVDERSEGIIGRIGSYIKQKTTQELERFKTTINLAEFATSFGYRKDEEKSEPNAVVLHHEKGDQIVVGRKSEDMQYMYINTKEKADRGSVIDFLKYGTHETMKKIAQQLKTWIKDPKPKEKIDVRSSTKESIEISDTWNRIEENDVCLARYWGFESLAGISEHKNAKYDKEGYFYFKTENINGICGIEKWNENERYSIEGSSRGVFVTGNLYEAERIAIFEDPVEMLSYKKLGRPLYNTATVSIMGDMDATIEAKIEEILKGNPKAEVFIAVKNDDKGDAATSKIKEILYRIDADANRATEDRPKTKGQSWHERMVEKKQRGASNRMGGASRIRR